jgi:hypothetical protein
MAQVVHSAAGLRAHVVARPQPPELRALERQLPDQLRQPRVVDVRTGQRPQPGHGVGETFPGIGEQLLDRVVEEGRANDVGPRPVHGGQGHHELVGGEDIHVAALHEGRLRRQGVQQPPHGHGHALGRP